MEQEPEASREGGAEKIDAFLERSGAYDFFSDLRQFPEKARDIPFERFRDFLDRINGIARDVPLNARSADGDRVYLSGFVSDEQVPRAEDKEPLLQMAYEAVGHLEHAGDERYLLPAVINAVHRYADGNGRTARVLNILLTQYASPSQQREKMKQAVRARFAVPNIDPSYATFDIEKIILTGHGIKSAEDFGFLPPDGFTRLFVIDNPESVKGREFAKLRRRDNWYAFVAAYEYLVQRNVLEQFTFVRGEARGLSMKKIDELLGDEGWQGIIDAYFRLKREHVETLIKAFREPERYRSRDGRTLRDAFLAQIERQYQHFQESDRG